MKASSKPKTIATPATKRPRGRPRKRPRSLSPSTSPSASPVAAPAPIPVKRRKPCKENETHQDNVFAIKDIIDEKLINGKRFFKIDWADDSTTGESFEPTWEPEENANGDAIQDWEREKQLRALLSLPSNSHLVRDPASDAPSELSYSGSIYIELQTRADFLESRPDFDTTSVIAISSSQLSNFPHEGPESELPPSQFWVTSSQPSQNVVIADSQPLVIGTLATHNVAPVKAPLGVSQTTIPDSQELSNEFSHSILEVPGTTAEFAQSQEEATSTKHSDKESSGSTIPSHQPNINQVSFAHNLLVEPDNHSLSQEDFHQNIYPPLPPATSGAQASPRPTSSANPLGSFLTQPTFEPGEFSPSAESKSQSPPHVATTVIQQSHLAENTSLEQSHQPAQRVSPLSGQASQFLTQPDIELSPASEDYDFIPDSLPPNPLQPGQLQQTPLHQPVADTVADSACLTTTIRSQDETKCSMMEESHSPIPKARSVMDELRAIQAQFIPAADTLSLGLPSGAEGTGDEGTRAREELLTPVSPSDIINSVEQDAIDNPEHASRHPPEGAASWAQEPETGYFADPLGPQHASTSATESNVASLANTTPASGAIDQAPDMDMAFTTAALGGGFDPHLHGTVNDLATISPALLAGSGSGGVGNTSLGGTPQILTDVAVTQGHGPVKQHVHDFGILPFEETAANEYLVALPPPARSRPEMVSIINSHAEEIESFDSYFLRGAARSPDSKPAIKVDTMLQTLTELSNLPPYHKDLQDLSQEQWMRYARETSSKLSFTYELLNRLRDCNMEVVILAAGGQVMEKVEAIVSRCSFTYRHSQQQDWFEASAEQGSACRVVLVDTSLKDVRPRLTENIVMAYDESAESSGLLQLYKTTQSEDQCPIIFTLVEAYSLEHINRRLSPAMDPLERKLAQVKCLILLLEHAEDHVFDSVPLPHDVAEDLAQYMVEDSTFHPPPTRWETWEHQQIPDEVFDTYKTLRSQLDPRREDRKRAREASSNDTETPKRPRIESSPADEAQLSEALKARFGTRVRVKGDMAQVSIKKLENLITLVGDLEAALSKKGEEVNDYAKTVRRFEPKYKEAIGDRGKFQVERDNALKRAAYLEKQLQRTETKLEQVKSDKQQLEKEQLDKLHELSKSDDPEVALAAKTRITEDTLQSTNKALIQKISLKEKEANYANTSYREVSQQMASVSKENAELKLHIRDLETRADANVVEIRRINNARMDDRLRSMYEQEKAMRIDREKEIERKNEEMRNYKARFGGRDTRGSSVPRSPRVRQMSSRNTSPVGDNGGSVNGNGSNGFGVGGTLFGPGRSHLRDL